MPPSTDPNKPLRRVCFSFAAYAKSLISSLKSSGVKVSAGLSDDEFTAIESAYGFSFPPDLRSILREGLPVSHSFPNWRSSPSDGHIRSLLTDPTNSILSRISSSTFDPPADNTEICIAKARSVLEKAPLLIPVFGNYYIPSSCCNGNPIFCVRRSGVVRCCCFDLMDLFKELVPKPAWAAREPKRVEMWTELAEAEEEDGRDVEGNTWRDIRRWLREGGWREDEVRELMMGAGDEGTWGFDREGVLWHVRVLAMVLLRSGWSREDVVYCMGSTKDEVVTWHEMEPTKEEKEVLISLEGDALALVDASNGSF